MTKDDVEYFRAFGRVICACCSRRIKRPYRAGVTRSRLPRLTQERKKERISHNQATLSPLLVWVSLLTPHSNTSLTHSLVLIALKKGMKYCIRCERFHPTFVWKNDFHQDEHPSFSSTHGPTPNEHQVEGERRKLARLFVNDGSGPNGHGGSDSTPSRSDGQLFFCKSGCRRAADATTNYSSRGGLEDDDFDDADDDLSSSFITADNHY
ncbi:hypothetical protein Fcan01_19726 [Folsomia candida]|uniref:Uncharacterized protein n=1 Tax=Folsomia candida TaxID=158441 RepID=A0A226DJX0_FOLCA|nr:hypothetical protein Fcan01_19726 [Folsomia candida]